MKKFILLTLLLVIFIGCIALTMLNDAQLMNANQNSGLPGEKGSPPSPFGADATATFSAEQFHLQLTAISEQGK